ncbi:hypothetical protein ACNQFZ_06665 [Schinkia sp. CFF1]
MKINTYPKMNKEIKNLLRLSGKQSSLYAAQRIEELEEEVGKLREQLKEKIE